GEEPEAGEPRGFVARRARLVARLDARGEAERLDDVARRHGETDRLAAGDLQRVDAEDAPGLVRERAAARAGIDRRRVLDVRERPRAVVEAEALVRDVAARRLVGRPADQAGEPGRDDRLL